jgi:hypothetical protein
MGCDLAQILRREMNMSAGDRRSRLGAALERHVLELRAGFFFQHVLKQTARSGGGRYRADDGVRLALGGID